MELNRLTRDADDLIRKVVSRYNQLYVPAGSVSQLELDLMLDDLRKLYETFKHIGHINLTLQDTLTKPEVKVNAAVPSDPQPAAPAAPTFSEKQYFAAEPFQATFHPDEAPESVTEPEVEIEPEYKPVYKPEPETAIATPDSTEVELITESEPEKAVETQVYATSATPGIEKTNPAITESTDSVNPEPATAMLADKFTTGNKSLSETMASSQANGVMGSRLQFQPIANLMTGIGLNDKFSFISDLFGNSGEKYDEAIHRINKAVNLDEANWILQKYHSAEWEIKQESLSRLKDFVKRRFI